MDWKQQYRDFKRIMGEWSVEQRRSLVAAKARQGIHGLRMLGYALRVERDPTVREAAVHAVALCAGVTEAKRLLRYARHGSPPERRGAFRGLLHLAETSGVRPLFPGAKDPAREMLRTFETGAQLGGGFTMQAAVRVLERFASDAQLRKGAIAAIQRATAPTVFGMGGPASAPPSDRLETVAALRSALAALFRATDSSNDPSVRVAAGRALVTMTEMLRPMPEHLLSPLRVEEVSGHLLALEDLLRRDRALAAEVLGASRASRSGGQR